MPNILHANAKTTPRIRKKIQEFKKSISELAQTLNLNVKTIKKWKDRENITLEFIANITMDNQQISNINEMWQEIPQDIFNLYKNNFENTAALNKNLELI
jgi:flagellar biosynthesis/type III secretory pathway chaperone